MSPKEKKPKKTDKAARKPESPSAKKEPKAAKPVKKAAPRKAPSRPLREVVGSALPKSARAPKKAELKPVATPPPPAPPAPPPPPASSEPYIDRGGDLPAAFGDDRIHALVRDPEWIFVYWELHGDRSNHLARTQGGGKSFNDLPWHLRVRSAVDGSLQQEIPIYVAASNWYIRTGAARKTSVEIGFYAPNGDFIVAAGTHPVTTPRGTPSPDRTEVWMRRAPGQGLQPTDKGFALIPSEPPHGGAIEITDDSGATPDRPKGSPGAFGGGAFRSSHLVRKPGGQP